MQTKPARSVPPDILSGGDDGCIYQEVDMGIFGNSDDKPKPKADFSDVQGGASSTAPAPAPAVPPPPAESTYTVVSGDSLSKIAKHVYGKASLWPRIFEANKDQIKNPDLIHPGQVLRIPALTTETK